MWCLRYDFRKCLRIAPKITVSGDLKADFIAERLNALYRASNCIFSVTLVEVKGAQTLIYFALTVQAMDNDNNTVSHGQYGPFVAMSANNPMITAPTGNY